MENNSQELLDLLNTLKPNRYVAVWLRGDGRTYRRTYSVVERGETLIVLPGDSVRVAAVKMRPLNVQLPTDVLNDVLNNQRVKSLVDKVGKPPNLRLFQYTLIPLVDTKVVQRLDTGAEFHQIVDEPAGPAIVAHVVHIFYVAYISNSGRVYDESPGGARAYRLLRSGELASPQIYIFYGKHRYEIGVRIPLDEQQFRPFVVYINKRA